MSYCHNYCIFSGVLICRSVFKGSLVISWLGKTGTDSRSSSLGWSTPRFHGAGRRGAAAAELRGRLGLPGEGAAGSAQKKKTKEDAGLLHH